MSVIQSCHDTKDVLDLFKPHGLFLKPISRLNVSVQLPTLKKSGAKISNWEVMERIKEMAKPLSFPVFKIAKSSLEFIRFEAEVENMGLMDSAIAKLDMKMIKLSGFEEQLKVRAAESKPPFPTRHDWDSYFKDNKNMNEMKAGERPDTIYLQNLPTKWFLDPYDRSGALKDKPSEYVLKKVFQTFGEIRALDIPSLDPYRNQMKSSIAGIQTFTFGQDLVFEAYIQYKEYIGFVKAMNSLKGMKLLNKDRHEEQRSWAANIKVDFDKTKHLSDAYIKKRQQERDKLIDKEREKEESERRRKELDEMKREQELRQMEEKERNEILAKEAAREEKIRRRMEREERRRQRKNQRKNVTDEEEISRRIAVEERKLLVAQRKLESIRLLDELLERVKVVQSTNEQEMKSLEKDLLKAAKAASKQHKGSDITTFISGKDQDELALRDKLVSKLKEKEIEKMKQYGENLKDSSFIFSDDGSMEEISDEDLENSDISEDPNDSLDEVSNEDLRLTSTDEETRTKKRKKKEKKRKKKKEEKRERKRRKKELDSQISLAQRIADRDHRSRSRDRDRHYHHRSPSPRKHHHMGRGRSREDEMQDHRAMVHERQLRARLESKRKEQALDEEYDRMVNGGGGYRKLRKGEHYEDVQKEFLENEIRIRERRKQYRGPPPDQDYHRQSHYHQDHRDHNYRDRGGRDHYRDQPRHYRR